MSETEPSTELGSQVSAAKRLAPDGANDRQILAAAYRAWEQSRDVRETLEEVLADDE